MDYKEKYEMALERAEGIIKYYKERNRDEAAIEDLQEIFPELKDSEDEKIRKELITHCRNTRCVTEEGAERIAKWIAWLEKQESLTTDEEKQGKEDVLWCIKQAMKYAKDENEMGTCWFAEQWLEKQGNKFKEKKTDNANKAEPKFKVGNWIVTDKNHIWLIDKDCSTTGFSYRLISQNGKVEVGDYNIVDEHARLWTIQDAKDGDVLYSPCCKLLWIYKDEKTCYVGSNLNYNSGSIVINKPTCIPTDVHPATKEQRDQLEKAMFDAGYKWNKEKLKLEKI